MRYMNNAAHAEKSENRYIILNIFQRRPSFANFYDLIYACLKKSFFKV